MPTTPPAAPEMPRAPTTVEETGLTFDLLQQLVLKALHVSGEQSAAALCARLGVVHSVLDPVLQHMKHSYLSEVWGGGTVGSPSYVYRVTEVGRERALMSLAQSQYIGRAPVPFSQYAAYMRAFTTSAPPSVTRARVEQAFSHLVLSPRVLDQLGPAINGGHSLFVYGPPGNGKTVISQGIARLFQGDVAIPHAIDFDGHLVQVFDPAVHEPVVRPESTSLDRGVVEDARWIRFRRPTVTVGGELTL